MNLPDKERQYVNRAKEVDKRGRPRSRYAPGKHPNSLKNLHGGSHPHNFVTRVAAALNWELRQVRASKAVGMHVFRMIFSTSYKEEWQDLTAERKDAIYKAQAAINLLRDAAAKCEDAILAVSKTPLRTPEALQQARIARRNRRPSRAALK